MSEPVIEPVASRVTRLPAAATPVPCLAGEIGHEHDGRRLDQGDRIDP